MYAIAEEPIWFFAKGSSTCGGVGRGEVGLDGEVGRGEVGLGGWAVV